MKIFALPVAAATLCLGVAAAHHGPLAHAFHSTARTQIDEPPPEPVDCPLCAGNAQLHVKRVMQIETELNSLAGYALRW